MGSLWGYFGDTLGTLQENPRDTLEAPWGLLGDTLEALCGHSKEHLWGHFGGTLGFPWDPTLYPHDPAGSPPPLSPPLPYLLAQRCISTAFRPYRPIAEHTGKGGRGWGSCAFLHDCMPLHERSLLHVCSTHTRLHASLWCSQASLCCKNGHFSTGMCFQPCTRAHFARAHTSP